ncbi:NADPH-dependent diflavin oxidoreductase 1-like isoform X1 [Homarus americanus]|uniref:NADPH-dependent diflavin oxidoreductase 1-like isoform X1 n=1 Tax=Homarus americanus TaxID=6706 RepID=UPI001C4841E1|nr:NADPH-dependent diflavin oxidoreductase 1-like isoform X1 [Homarus americanus]XP_042203497.1 NADPH-dependent diflavin oxidoreductase 1-like isoform X1 [Homarus americanus]
MDPPASRSRLEINFIRLLEETQQMANGNKQKDWTFEKLMNDRRLVILFGSQTGTAQEVAERIGRESRRYYFIPIVSAMDDYPVEDLTKTPLVVFVASTTGQGDDPDNMKIFFRTLWSQRKNRQLLVNLKFGVIGLGDSSYQKFNFVAKRLNNLITFLGGQPILKLGLGDDQHDLGPDFVIDPWLKSWWSLVLELHPLPEGRKPLSASVLLPPKYKVKIFNADASKYDHVQDNCVSGSQGEACAASPCSAKITMNRRVTSSDFFQDVRLIEFDITGIKTKHKPGDVLVVQPQNLEEHVDEFISLLDLDPDELFYLESNDPNVSLPPAAVLPRPCTMRECVQKYFDILAIPKRYFFELLALFTKDENEKEKFQEFSSAEGQQDLYDYCNRPKRSIMEVLADFPHTRHNIPLEYLFDLLPSIKPRSYSIASSSLALPNIAQLLVAVVNYRTVLKRPRLGLCTNWLARQSVGNRVPVWIKPGTLTFPSLTSGAVPPVVMIGPGTGCAPFRAYIQERVASGHHKDIIMIFGCRNKDKDYFFKEEWEALAKEQKLELYCAFSRDQEDKIYVQHKMRENASKLWTLIGTQRAMIYFAGNAKRVPIDVYEALTYICEKGRGQGTQDAEQYMKKDVEKRYQTETWA